MWETGKPHTTVALRQWTSLGVETVGRDRGYGGRQRGLRRGGRA